MDLIFRTGYGLFNYRVGAIIIHNGKYLMMRNAEAPYVYSVGGRVHYGETTEEAVIREVFEETGVSLEVDRPLFFQEQIFDEEVSKEHVHEIGVYYLMKDSDCLDHLNCRSVTARGVSEELVWIPKDELGKYNIVPVCVAKRLLNLPENMKHLVETPEGEREVTFH